MGRHVMDCAGNVWAFDEHVPKLSRREGEQLPTFEQLAQRVQANMKITVRDVWGLMLTALPGGLSRHKYQHCSWHSALQVRLCIKTFNLGWAL